jgi:hypothetical protein
MASFLRSTAIVLALAFTLGCAQFKEGFKGGWEDAKKTFSGKEEKPAKEAKAGEAKPKPKEAPAAEPTADPGKKPAAGTKPEGIFGPK